MRLLNSNTFRGIYLQLLDIKIHKESFVTYIFIAITKDQISLKILDYNF